MGGTALPAERERKAASEELATTLKALAHPARVRIVEMIHARGGEICVCEFAGHLDLSQPTISHHLRVLRDAGLIESRQEGTWVYHTVRREAMAAVVGRLAEWASAPRERRTASACCSPDSGPGPRR